MTNKEIRKLLERHKTKFVIKNVFETFTSHSKKLKEFETLKFKYDSTSYGFYHLGEPKGNMFFFKFNEASVKVYDVNVLNEYNYSNIKYKDVIIIK